MSFSSVEARSANRATGNFILVLLAILLAALSTAIGDGAEQSSRKTQAIEVGTPPKVQVASVPRSMFVADAQASQVRRYHSTFENSDTAGALGFWILISLFSILLGAAAAPGLIHRLKKQD